MKTPPAASNDLVLAVTVAVVGLLTIFTLASCTALQPQPILAPPLEPAHFTQAQPHTTVPPDPLDSLPPAIRRAYLRGSNAPIRAGFAVFYPYHEYSEPVIHCAPEHVTEVVFGPNEKVTAATVGDSVRWSLLPERNHVRVKPCPEGCSTGGGTAQPIVSAPSVFSTNLIVDTDRRTYHLKLQAGPLSHANEAVAFWYPHNIASAEAARTAAMRKAAEEVADPPATLNFAYRITGPNVPFKPIQAFDDGSHEYLLFSSIAALETDMPALYVQQGKTQELVNYQVRGNYYIADRLYSDAALTQGVGADRQTIRIEAIR
jgi:P-type conjugative transfer protein TrbG